MVRLRLTAPKCQAPQQPSIAAPVQQPLPSSSAFVQMIQTGPANREEAIRSSKKGPRDVPSTTPTPAMPLTPAKELINSSMGPPSAPHKPLSIFSASSLLFPPAGSPTPASVRAFSAPPAAPLLPAVSFPPSVPLTAFAAPSAAPLFPPASFPPPTSVPAFSTPPTAPFSLGTYINAPPPVPIVPTAPFLAFQPPTSLFPSLSAPFSAPSLPRFPGSAAWNDGLSYLTEFAKANPNAWCTLVGLYVMHPMNAPNRIALWDNRTRKLAESWRRDVVKLDWRDRSPLEAADGWEAYPREQLVTNLTQQIAIDPFKGRVLEEAIRQWTSQPQNDNTLVAILEKADWTQSNLMSSHEYQLIDKILAMEYCEEKDLLVQQAQHEAPRTFAECLKHPWCGSRIITKYREPHNPSDPTYKVCQYRKLGTFEHDAIEDTKPPSPRKTEILMEGVLGRPTQVHGVPPEERALDSKGNKLPWGLEWHEDHPNARGQKRYVEESGPFGKSSRRKGSSRVRTTTPAKKENPTLDGFDKALNFTLSQDAQSQQAPPSSRLQNEGNLTAQAAISHNKQPTQVIIFGYSSESQWAALDFYEKASYGMICEDYARDPPAAAKRYPTTFSSPRRTKRPLTKAERSLVFKYNGGHAWVKVTFDSAETAERAVESSPTKIYGHWVYAQLWRGVEPEHDEPMPIKEGERGLRQPMTKPQTMGPSRGQQKNFPQVSGATLPRSFAPSAQASTEQSNDTSPSSSTATSGTATGVDYPDLRRGKVSPPANIDQQPQPSHNPRMMRHFPDIPRTVLRPASEAFLPQPTWWEKQLKWLSDKGLIPGEIIGLGIPLTDEGRVDLSKASFYWRFFYWIDSTFGTDFCGLKDED